MLEEELGIVAPIRFLICLSIFAGCWVRFFLFPAYIIFLPFVFKGCIFFLLGLVLVVYFKIIKIALIHESKIARKFFFYLRSI